MRLGKAGTHRIKTNTGATSPERESPTTIGSSGPVAGREGTGSRCGSNGGFCAAVMSSKGQLSVLTFLVRGEGVPFIDTPFKEEDRIAQAAPLESAVQGRGHHFHEEGAPLPRGRL